MSTVLLIALLAAEPSIADKHWRCSRVDGTAKAEATISGELTFKPDTLEFTFQSGAFAAKGTGVAQAGFYRGRLAAADGATFWFNLDRYSGEFALLRDSRSGAQLGTSEYFGVCR